MIRELKVVSCNISSVNYIEFSVDIFKNSEPTPRQRLLIILTYEEIVGKTKAELAQLFKTKIRNVGDVSVHDFLIKFAAKINDKIDTISVVDNGN